MEGQTVGTDRRARTGGAFVDLRPPKPPEVPHSPPKLPEDIQNLGVLGADTKRLRPFHFIFDVGSFNINISHHAQPP